MRSHGPVSYEKLVFLRIAKYELFLWENAPHDKCALDDYRRRGQPLG
jgi:hypothetical protein